MDLRILENCLKIIKSNCKQKQEKELVELSLEDLGN